MDWYDMIRSTQIVISNFNRLLYIQNTNIFFFLLFAGGELSWDQNVIICNLKQTEGKIER